MNENLEAVASQADKALPGAEVEIGGKKRRLKYTLYSLCKLDEKTGKNPLDGTMFLDMRPADVVAVLWAGLIHDEPELTTDELAKVVDITELRDVSKEMMKAFAQASPVNDSKKNSTSEETELEKGQETPTE